MTLEIIGRIAQSVEQGIENPRVGGSIPPPATIFHTSLFYNLLNLLFFYG